MVHDENKQLVCYDPGVGTYGSYSGFTPGLRTFKRVLGLAFGYGLTKNIADAYIYIMQNYREGDQIYLFGFSRGAYTARAVAAMLRKCGLLYANNQNLIPETLRIFKENQNFRLAAKFRTSFARKCRVHFLGLWDTVTSVGWIWDPARLDFTTTNRNVDIVRHAVAIDERRAFFRQNLWRQHPKKQDVVQAWFAGAHADVGGAYETNESQLSQIGLKWILAEAHAHGLHVDKKRLGKILRDPKPDFLRKEHNSLNWRWLLAEIFPKLVSKQIGPEGKKQWVRRVRFNLGRRRYISFDATVHESVARRIAQSDYAPSNLRIESGDDSLRILSSKYAIVADKEVD